MEFGISEKKPVGVLTVQKPWVTSERTILVGPKSAWERETDPQDSGFPLLVLCTT